MKTKLFVAGTVVALALITWGQVAAGQSPDYCSQGVIELYERLFRTGDSDWQEVGQAYSNVREAVQGVPPAAQLFMNADLGWQRFKPLMEISGWFWSGIGVLSAVLGLFPSEWDRRYHPDKQQSLLQGALLAAGFAGASFWAASPQAKHLFYGNYAHRAVKIYNEVWSKDCS